MSESRLFKILYYLLDKGTVTAPELAKKFEVSVRTIYRDIDMFWTVKSSNKKITLSCKFMVSLSC